MAERAVLQPNGKYAVFSSIVDNFVLYDATSEEIWTYFRDAAGMRRANEAVKNADEDRNMDGSKGRFEDCMRTIRNIHGAEQEKLAREMIGGMGSEPVLKSHEEAPHA